MSDCIAFAIISLERRAEKGVDFFELFDYIGVVNICAEAQMFTKCFCRRMVKYKGVSLCKKIIACTIWMNS